MIVCGGKSESVALLVTVKVASAATVRFACAGRLGNVLLALLQHKQACALIEIVSMRHPALPLLSSEPQRQRSWTVCPEAPAGRLTVVVMYPPEFPLQACRPASGLL